MWQSKWWPGDQIRNICLLLRNTKQADKKIHSYVEYQKYNSWALSLVATASKMDFFSHWLVLFLLHLISVGSRADICLGQWESLHEGTKMLVKGSFSIRPPRPFAIGFHAHHFAQMGKFGHSRSIFISSASYLMFPRTWLRGQHLHQGDCSISPWWFKMVKSSPPSPFIKVELMDHMIICQRWRQTWLLTSPPTSCLGSTSTGPTGCQDQFMIIICISLKTWMYNFPSLTSATSCTSPPTKSGRWSSCSTSSPSFRQCAKMPTWS